MRMCIMLNLLIVNCMMQEATPHRDDANQTPDQKPIDKPHKPVRAGTPARRDRFGEIMPHK